MTAALALLSSVLWGAADFLGGTASRRVHPVAVVGLSQALALVGLVVVATLTGELDAPLGYLPWAVAGGAVGLIALVAFYAALAVGTMGVVAPVAATGAAVPVVIGLARGEQPSALQLAGIAVAVVGVVLASGPELRPAAEVLSAAGSGQVTTATRPSGRTRWSAGVPLLLAGVAAVGFGLVLVLVAEGSRHSAVMTLLGMRVTSVVAVTVVAVGRRSAGGLSRSDLPLIAAIGAGDTLANGAYAVASQDGLVSVTAVLASLYPAVTVLLARLVHGERMRRIQNAGCLAALLGVALIASG